MPETAPADLSSPESLHSLRRWRLPHLYKRVLDSVERFLAAALRAFCSRPGPGRIEQRAEQRDERLHVDLLVDLLRVHNVRPRIALDEAHRAVCLRDHVEAKECVPHRIEARLLDDGLEHRPRPPHRVHDRVEEGRAIDVGPFQPRQREDLDLGILVHVPGVLDVDLVRRRACVVHRAVGNDKGVPTHVQRAAVRDEIGPDHELAAPP
mmetsp:Transcript_31730/g.91149  ORF Transcript_31730/g.91149 Transcript_31730/m.91149 type:complete len:208 (+) Transcript_31730:49-672(+)